jgi:DNA-binding transcriptional LysR family regulator
VVARDIKVGAICEHLFLAVAAAIGSAGLWVVPRIVVQDQLDLGALVLADEEEVASGTTYFAYVNDRSKHVEVARDFSRWLKRTLRDRERST